MTEPKRTHRPYDREIIATYVTSDLPASRIAAQAGVTKTTVYRAIHRLEVNRGNAVARRKRLWTPEEDAKIVDPPVDDLALSREMDRTVYAIRSRRKLLRDRGDL